jgi:hypothetical protein
MGKRGSASLQHVRSWRAELPLCRNFRRRKCGSGGPNVAIVLACRLSLKRGDD